MSCSNLTKIAHAVDRRHYVKIKGVDMMFNAQNYPMSLIRKYVASLIKEGGFCYRQDNFEKYLHEIKR